MRNYPQFVPWRLWGRLLLVGLVIAGLSGCAPDKISKDNFDKIKLGMTQEEVQAILGPPTESSGLEIPAFSGTMSKWVKGDAAINIQFVNGRVVAKEFAKPSKK